MSDFPVLALQVVFQPSLAEIFATLRAIDSELARILILLYLLLSTLLSMLAHTVFHHIVVTLARVLAT